MRVTNIVVSCCVEGVSVLGCIHGFAGFCGHLITDVRNAVLLFQRGRLLPADEDQITVGK